jgi:outer membrane protein assembly factor BamB
LAVILIAGVGVPLAVVAGLVLRAIGVVGSPGWNGNVYATADVNGDGVMDFIGFTRYVSTDQMRLAAISGTDGKLLWETPSLGKYHDVYTDAVEQVGGNVLVADKLAHLEAYGLKTGTRRWSVTAPEVVSAICPGPSPDVALVATADRRVWALSLGGGKLTPSPGACASRTWRSDPPGSTRISTRSDLVPGMRIDNVFAKGAGLSIAVGEKYPGSSIPMVAGIDPSGAVVWKSEVPGHDPLKVTDRVDYLDLSDRYVAVAYKRNDKTPSEVAVFDRATGARRFETPLAKSFMNVLSGVNLTPTSVAVSSWGNLQVFDLSTGARRFTVGN